MFKELKYKTDFVVMRIMIIFGIIEGVTQGWTMAFGAFMIVSLIIGQSRDIKIKIDEMENK